MRAKILAILCMVLFGFSLYGEEARKDSIIVSIITCSPGEEIYELCGHAAVRIRGVADGQPIDSVWNYGVFDFNQPNFVYRFVKGETDYRVAGYPFEWFMPEYVEGHRTVTEQDLNLTDAEKKQMLGILRTATLPENCVYRYNYVKNNCATKIIDVLDSAAQSRVIYPDNVEYGTFRNEMRAYHKNYPWYQFGIDLALGSGLDYQLRGREEMFVPTEMMKKLDGSHFENGNPVVSEKRVLFQGDESAVLPPTPWYLTPLAFSSLWLLICLGTGIYEICKKRIVKIIYTIWFGICGLAGCLIAFLVFISTHEASSPNLLLLWLNPLQLIFCVSVWSRKMRYVSTAMAWLNAVVSGCMLITWPFQAQSANPAFFPLMGATFVLAAAYAYVAYQQFENEKTNNNGALWSGDYEHSSSGRTQRRRTTTPRGRNRH